MTLERINQSFKAGEPIFAKEIISLFPEYTKAYVFRMIKKAEAEGNLVRFSRGVYCIPKKAFFGYSTITSGMVAYQRYIGDGEFAYGVYSGMTLLNQFGFSTQVPNVVEIVTNRESTRKRTVVIDGMKFILRKSRFEITRGNQVYYTVLQLLSEFDSDAPVSDYSKRRIKEYIDEKSIDKDKLVQYAMRFPSRVSKNLLRLGILDGTI